jgi:hypothetical protein
MCCTLKQLTTIAILFCPRVENVHETNVDFVRHSRKFRSVFIHVFFNYLQGLAAMNPKLGAFFILPYNFGSDQLSFRSVFSYFLWGIWRSLLRSSYELLVNITLYKWKLKRNNIVFIWVNWLWENPVTKPRYNTKK